MITSVPVFIGLTLVLFGGCAVLTGQALGRTWRPWWQAAPYGVMLGAAERFLNYALFQGELLSIAGFVLDGCILVALALAARRLTLARLMTRQYPWLFERSGPFTWKEIGRD